jgi:hypothetical protein
MSTLISEIRRSVARAQGPQILELGYNDDGELSVVSTTSHMALLEQVSAGRRVRLRARWGEWRLPCVLRSWPRTITSPHHLQAEAAAGGLRTLLDSSASVEAPGPVVVALAVQRSAAYLTAVLAVLSVG